VAAGIGFDSEDVNETGEILGILFNASGYCSPGVGGGHEAGVRRGIAGIGTAEPGLEHDDCGSGTL